MAGATRGKSSSDLGQELARALRTAAVGELEHAGAPLELAKALIAQGSAHAGAGSSRQAREAFAAASGLSNREIAAALQLAPATVENQLAGVCRKLAVSSRSQLQATLNGN